MAEVIRFPINPNSLTPADVAALRALVPSLPGSWVVEVDDCAEEDEPGPYLVACLVPSWAAGLASVTVEREAGQVAITDMRAGGMGQRRDFRNMAAAVEHMADILGTKPTQARLRSL